jgi:photosystem II stability/assembly factor-like uncharacterized protein
MFRITVIAASVFYFGQAVAAQAIRSEPYTWANVPILGGGFVSGIITHPTERGLIYARTDIGGAYRWDESIKRWIPLTDWTTIETWNYTGIESLAVDPKDPERVYIAAGTYTNDWAGNGAILRSRDRGKTWEMTDLPFKNGGNEDGRNAGERLAVDPNDGRIIYFGTRNQGLWRSTDSGVAWSRVESFPIRSRTNGVGLVFVIFDPSSGRRGEPTKTLYIGVSGADPIVHRSVDAGDTWHAVPGAPAGMLPNHGVLAPDGALYLTVANAPGPNGMTDGAVWKFDTRSTQWTNISPVKPGNDDRFGYSGVSVDPQHRETIVVSTMDRWARKDNLFRSRDGGRSWESLLDKAIFDHTNAPYTKKLTPHWTGDVELNPFDPDHLMFVTGYGIWASRDGGKHWTFDNDGLEECVISELISPAGGDAVVLSAMGDQDGFRHVSLESSPANGAFEPGYGNSTSIDFAEDNPQLVARVYGGENNTHGSYSTDNGVTWAAFPTAPPGRGHGAIAVSSDGQVLVWAQENVGQVWSNDLGKTWNTSTGLRRGVRVISDRADPQRFYAYDNQSGEFLASTTAGRSFERVTGGLPTGDATIRAVPGHAGHVWLATTGGLFRSADSGKGFAEIGSFRPAYRVAFGKPVPGQSHPAVYVIGKLSGTYGIYRSDDAGMSWVRINDDQQQFAYIHAIAGDPRVYGRVYLGSASRGVIYGQPARTTGME